MTYAGRLTPPAARGVIAARLSGDTQCVDEAAGLYIDEVSVSDHGLEVTVVDEDGQALTVSLASPVEIRVAAHRVKSRRARHPLEGGFEDGQEQQPSAARVAVGGANPRGALGRLSG